MRVVFPRAAAPALQGRPEPLDPEWVRYLRTLQQAIGLGSAPVWGDVFVAGAMLSLDAGAAPSHGVVAGSVRALAFPSSGNDGAQAALAVPLDAQAGAALRPYLLWIASSSGAGSVVWQIEFARLSVGEVVGETSTLAETVDAPGVVGRLERVEFDEIVAGQPGEVIALRVGRQSDDAADDYGDDAYLVGVGIRYRVAGVGSEVTWP